MGVRRSHLHTEVCVASWSEILTTKAVNCPGATEKDKVALSFGYSAHIREKSHQLEA
jgi:hypothetical protein